MTTFISTTTVRASSIGATAWRAALLAHSARVIGVTSRGLFLSTPAQQIIFVSRESYRGSVTINLDRSLERIRSLEVDAAAQFSDSRLIFPAIEFAISLSEDVVWKCPMPQGVARPLPDQKQTLRAIVASALERHSVEEPAALLPTLLSRADTSPLSAGQSALLERLLALQQAVRTGDHAVLVAGLTKLLGQGRGLTPSGDDVAMGLLLMLNRWRPERDWAEVNRAVIDAAYRRTTTISANLIECAAEGQGDERLITVVDGIVAGSASVDECVDCVLAWGSSSGVDALVGMAIAL